MCHGLYPGPPISNALYTISKQMSIPAVPRLRGVFHQWALVAAMAAGVVLLALARGAREMVAVWVYVVALSAMFGASALYHRFPWRTAVARARARRVDHAAIFVFIAGTYTPFALLALDGWTQGIVLVTVWAGAALGTALTLVWVEAPSWMRALAYLAVGWVGVIAIPQLFAVGIASGVLLAVGGGLYTLGAVTYALQWPNPFPRTLGFHEVFHLLVVAAVAVQCIAVYFVVL
jgi:hemolysin III